MTNFTVNNISLFSDNEIHKIGNADMCLIFIFHKDVKLNKQIGELIARYIYTIHNKSKSGSNYNQNVYDQRSISTHHKIKFHGCLYR